MTNEDLATIAALAACALEGLVTRKSATTIRARAEGCLHHFPETRAALLGYLDSLEPSAPPVKVPADNTVAVAQVKAKLGDKALRQNSLERLMGLPDGCLDDVLTEANGFTVNAQGWVRVAESAGVA